MIQLITDYWVYVAIYWLVMFACLLIKDPPKDEPLIVWIWMFVFSFIMPALLIFFIVRATINKVKDN